MTGDSGNLGEGTGPVGVGRGVGRDLFEYKISGRYSGSMLWSIRDDMFNFILVLLIV